MDWYIFVPTGLLGMIIGSFLNVVIYRLPRNESLVKPRSHCPNCKSQIPFYRNIPVLTFLLQRGKCSECSQPISWQYPLVELINGLIWGWAFSELSFEYALFLSVLGSILLTIAWIDSQHFLIPLVLSVSAVVIVLTAIFFSLIEWQWAIFGVLIGAVLPALSAGLLYLKSRKQGMGFGDIQLGFILGLWLGPYQMGFTLILASILVIVVWVMLSLKSTWDRNRPIPFAPYLIVSSFLVYITNYYQSDFITGLLYN